MVLAVRLLAIEVRRRCIGRRPHDHARRATTEVIGVLPESVPVPRHASGSGAPIQFDRSKILSREVQLLGGRTAEAGNVTVAQANADVARHDPNRDREVSAVPGFSAKMFEDARLGRWSQPLKESWSAI